MCGQAFKTKRLLYKHKAVVGHKETHRSGESAANAVDDGLGCGQDDNEAYGSDIEGKEDDVHGNGKSSGQDDGEHGDVDCESSDSGDDADADGESSGSGDDAEGIEYKWFEGVAKKVAFTHSACDDFCRNTAIHGGEDVEITSEEIEAHDGAIECNICNWV